MLDRLKESKAWISVHAVSMISEQFLGHLFWGLFSQYFIFSFFSNKNSNV